MKLLLDLGNTRIKWAHSTTGASAFDRQGEYLYGGRSPEDLLDGLWSAAMPPESVWLCSVIDPGFAAAFEQAMRRRWDCPVHWVRPQVEGFGVRCAYVNPLRLGADRWAAMVGARVLQRGAVCILHLGTTLTADVLDSSGCHLGGIIAPGRRMLQRSLQCGTAQVITDSDEMQWPEQDRLGRDTDACVAWGVRHSLIGCCREVLGAARSRLGGEMAVILAGGDACWAQDLLSCASQVEPDLVLRGVAMIADG